MTPDQANQIRRGINLGNALDTVDSDQPRLRLKERYFDDIRHAGFDTVRLPVRWSAHAADSAPYTIDPEFFARVDWAVDQALRRDLTVVLNVHHYHELQRAPGAHTARFLALWRQIAAHYNRPAAVYFELLNEARDAMTAQRWNQLIPEALATIRDSQPDRVVVAGTARMNAIDALPELQLPADDHLMVTVHYYAPFAFTHQGAAWVAGADRWLGTTWGTDADRAAVRRDLTAAAAWERETGHRVFVGEFGTYAAADLASRLRWTAYVRAESERLGLSWCYWEFGTDFGVFDPDRGAWRDSLRGALLPAGGS